MGCGRYDTDAYEMWLVYFFILKPDRFLRRSWPFLRYSFLLLSIDDEPFNLLPNPFCLLSCDNSAVGEPSCVAIKL